MAGQQVIVSVLGDVKDFSAKMAKTQEVTTKTFAGIAGAVAGSKIFSALKDLGVQALDAMKEYGDDFDALADQLGADGAKSFSEGFAANVKGANIQEAMGLGSELSKTITGTLGLAGKEAQALTEQMTQGVLDIAASTDTGAEQVAQAVTTFLQGKDKALAKTLGMDQKVIKSLVQQKMKTDGLTESQARQAVAQELMAERAGEAEADTKTLSGAIKELTDGFEDTGTVLIQTLMPYIEQFSDWLVNSVVPAVQSLATWISENKELVTGLAVGLAVLVGAFQLLSGALAVISAVQAFVGVMQSLKIVQGLSTAAQWLWNAALTANPIGIVIAAIAALVAGLVYFFTQTETGRKAWETFTKTLTDLWKKFSRFIEDTWKSITRFFSDAASAVSTTWNNTWKAITGFFTGAATKVIDTWTGVSQWFGELPGKIRAFFTGAIDWLVSGGKNILNGLKNGAVDAWNGVSSWIGGLKDKVMDKFSGAGKWLVNTGQNLISGLWNGINDKVGWIKNKISGFVGNVEKWFKNFFGIASPSKLMRKLGKFLPEGLGLGIDDGSPRAFQAMGRLSTGVEGAFEPHLAMAAPGGAYAGGNSYTINVSAVAPNAEVGRAVTQAIRDYERTGGRR